MKKILIMSIVLVTLLLSFGTASAHWYHRFYFGFALPPLSIWAPPPPVVAPPPYPYYHGYGPGYYGYRVWVPGYWEQTWTPYGWRRTWVPGYWRYRP